MRTEEVNTDKLKVIKLGSEVSHIKRGKERKVTFLIEGVDEDGDKFIYKKVATVPSSINLAKGQEFPPYSVALKIYGIEGEKYIQVVKLLNQDTKSDKKLSWDNLQSSK